MPVWNPPAAVGLTYGYDNPVRTSPCVPLPQTGAAPLAINGAAGAWGSWVEVTAGEAAAYILAQVVCVIIPVASEVWWIQLGTGAADSESPIATVAGATLVAGAGSIPLHNQTFRLPPFLLAANTRLACRARASPGTTVNDLRTTVIVNAWPSPPAGFITGWDGDTYLEGNAGNLQLITPAIPGSTNVASAASANGYGAWVPFIASASQRLRIIGVQSHFVIAARTAHFQVGTGAADSEVAHELTSAPGWATLNSMGWCPFPRGVDVAAGERVALRARDHHPAATNWPLSLVYEQVSV